MRDTTSPRYAVFHYRLIPQETVNALEEFLSFVEYDKEWEGDALESIKALIDEFLGRSEQVKQGELEMFERWKG